MNERSKISCVTITPRGKEVGWEEYCCIPTAQPQRRKFSLCAPVHEIGTQVVAGLTLVSRGFDWSGFFSDGGAFST
jgi:hypothetical protein